MEKDTTYILSFDNGTTASYCLIAPNGKLKAFEHIPTMSENLWTKPVEKKHKNGKKYMFQRSMTQIDIDALQRKLATLTATLQNVHAYVEIPAVTFSSGWSAFTSLSAVCAWTRLVYVLRKLKIPFTYVTAKTWQSEMIPEATGKNNKEYMKTVNKKKGERNKLLKEASDALAKELFPEVQLKESGDGDSLVMGEYFRQLRQGMKHESDN